MTSTPPPYGQQPYGPPAQQPYGGPPPSAPYGPPSQPMYGPPQQQPYGAPGYPPPPPVGAFDQTVGTVPAAAWLIPVAALLAVIGAFTPWFKSSIVRDGQTLQSLGDLYSWRDGRIGLLPPIALVVISIGVVQLMRGRTVGRFSRGSTHPVVSASRGALIIGAVTFLFLAIAWFEVPSNYHFTGRYGEDSTSSYLDRLSTTGHTATLSRGPQIGFYLTLVAGVLVIVAAVLMLVTRDKTAADVPAGFPPPGWSAPPPGFPPPAAPADGGWSSPTSYSHEQSGTEG